MNECTGCKYEDSVDIVEAISICTYCKRAYSREEDREMHEDKYEEKNDG